MTREEDINRIIEAYGNSIYRMSFFMLQNEQDAQDVLQETMIKYMQKAPDFVSGQHEKAWLLRVAGNLCKDMLRFQKRNRCVNLEELQETAAHGQQEYLIEQVFSLPEKYKKVIYLYYYEGYSVKEMAVIFRISEGTVRKRLERGRNQLRRMLEEDM